MILKKKITTPNPLLIDRFSALGDSTRFQLLTLLSQHEDFCVSELAEAVGISTAGVSQQLKILEHAGLLKRNRQGQKICYKIDDDSNVNKQLLSLIKEVK